MKVTKFSIETSTMAAIPSSGTTISSMLKVKMAKPNSSVVVASTISPSAKDTTAPETSSLVVALLTMKLIDTDDRPYPDPSPDPDPYPLPPHSTGSSPLAKQNLGSEV